MASTRPFAYNPTLTPISGTIQVGTIAVGTIGENYGDNYGGLTWWMGPDEDTGYVILVPVSGNTQPTQIPGVFASLGAFGTKSFNDVDFINLSEYVSNIYDTPQTFGTASDASTWLTNNGYWNSYPTVGVTPTPTATPTGTLIPATPTPTATQTNTPTGTLIPATPTPTTTQTNTPTGTPIPATPTPTTTPTSTQTPVTGYSFNLVVLPYNYPTSGNTIMVDQSTPSIGTTNPNVFATTNNAIYFNTIDTNGVNRSNYFASFTGQSITLTISQTGSTAIYSGDSKAFQSWTSGGDSGFTFGYGVAQPGYSAGTTTLIQSAPTNWVTGQTVYISAVVNGAGVTPTPTATSVTPTPTPTSGGTGGWLFYSPNNSPVTTPPNSNGNTAFIDTTTGFGTYSPNYTGGTLNLYFNNTTSNGTSYASQFSTLDTAGGTITISQGSSTAIYSGTSADYQAASSFTFLSVTRSAQMIQAASTPFVSGTSINVVVS